MGSQGRVRESITGDDGAVGGHGILGHPGEVGVRVIDVEQTESLGEASGPFKVVHERPGRVATDVHLI